MYSTIIGRNGVINEQTHEDYENGELNFKVKTSAAMCPLSYLIVYYIQPSGEVIYDSIRIELDTPLPNDVSIKN